MKPYTTNTMTPMPYRRETVKSYKAMKPYGTNQHTIKAHGTYYSVAPIHYRRETVKGYEAEHTTVKIYGTYSAAPKPYRKEIVKEYGATQQTVKQYDIKPKTVVKAYGTYTIAPKPYEKEAVGPIATNHYKKHSV